MSTVQYLIRRDVLNEVLAEVGNKVIHSASIVLTINHAGSLFLWMVRNDLEDNTRLNSALILQSACQDEWRRIESLTNEYKGTPPRGTLPEPQWPTRTSFPKMLKLAFGNSRIIDSVEHPAVKAVLGITS